LTDIPELLSFRTASLHVLFFPDGLKQET